MPRPDRLFRLLQALRTLPSPVTIEALVLGLAEVRHMGDPALARAAAAVLAKVAATLPSLRQQHLLHAVSQVHRFEERYPTLPDMDALRDACWREEALAIRYKDKSGRVTRRVIWPLAIVYLDRLLVVLAWCCLRQGFRKFQAGRISRVASTGETFRPRRAAMLRSYLVELGNERAPENAGPRGRGTPARA